MMIDHKNSIVLPLLNTIALIGVLTVNAMANILPINGMNTGEVSALYPSLFTPAGITFSIWSAIYLLLLGFVLFQWIRLRDTEINRIIRSLTPLFILSSAFNMAWIIAWHYLYVWPSVLIMLGLLTTLTILFLRIHQTKALSSASRWLIELPFTIYLAWICVATIANLATALIASSWGGFGVPDETWTILMILVAVALATYITLQYQRPAFAAVVIWALAGIFLRWRGSEQIMIANSALLLAVLLAGIAVYTLLRKVRHVS